MKLDVKQFEDKMKKTIAAYEEELASIRVGRANAKVLDRVEALYYGTPTPINQMAEIKVPDPRTLVVTPWDATSLKAIEKAIQASDVGITPANDGKCIRLVFPPLTEERRKELTKTVAKKSEDCKVVVRGLRRDEIEKYKAMKKKSEITEDDLKGIEKDIQTMTDDYIKKIDTISKAKEKEVLEV